MSIIKRQTILGTVYSYIGVAIGTLTMALLVPNYFSKEEYGLIGMLTRDMMGFVVLISLGFNQAGNRFFSYFRDPRSNHRGYLFNGLLILAAGTVLVVFILYFFKDWLQFSEESDNSLYIRYYYLLIPLIISTGLFNLFDNYAKGLFDTVTGTFLSQLLIRLLVFICVLAYIFEQIDFHQFIIWWTVSMCLPSLLMIIHASRLGNFSLKFDPYFWQSDFRTEFFRFAAFGLTTTMATIIIQILDNRMVYTFLGLGMSGIYSFCLLFGSVMTMSYNANIKASTSIMLDSLLKNEMDKIKQIFVKSAITQLMFGVVVLVLVWASIDSIFSLVKPEFAAGKTALIIIGLAKLYDLGSGINSLILPFSKYYKYDSLLAVSFIITLFVLNWFLIPRYGLNGAAAGTLLATIYYNSVRNFLIWKYFGIHPFSRKQMNVLLIGLVILGVGFLLPEIKGSFILSFVSVLYKSFILAILFAVSFYKLNISEEINQLIDKGRALFLQK